MSRYKPLPHQNISFAPNPFASQAKKGSKAQTIHPMAPDRRCCPTCHVMGYQEGIIGICPQCGDTLWTKRDELAQ